MTGFVPLVAMVFLGAFSAVFFWGGVGSRPQAATGIEPLAIADAPSEAELRERTWPGSAERIDAEQPATGFAPELSAPGGSMRGQGAARRFTRCAMGSRAACVVDGDTIWLDGTKIRMADYNTPEVGNPGCARERQLGERATDRLLGLLNSGEVALRPNPQGRATDPYGRALRIVTVDGRSVGDTLVGEGLAHEWRGRREEWC